MADELTMSRALLEDFKRFAVAKDRERIINDLDDVLAKRQQNTLGPNRPYSKTFNIDDIINIVNNTKGDN